MSAPNPPLPDLAIFQGSVCHHRRRPHTYRFRQPLLMLFINTEQLHRAVEKIRPLARLGILNWRRADYLPDPHRSLTESALTALERLTGIRAAGPVYLLAQPRQFGIAYNPITFYFICDGSNRNAAHLLVEVHNTPWNERFCYAGTYGTPLASGNNVIKKQHRVSPFNPMEMTYEWRYNQPQEKFHIHMRCYHQNTLHFAATLMMRRQPFLYRHLMPALLRRPFSSLTALIAIYRHAFILWLRKTPLHLSQFDARKTKSL